MDSSEYRLELARYRLKDSTDRLSVAKELFEAGNYKDASEQVENAETVLHMVTELLGLR